MCREKQKHHHFYCCYTIENSQQVLYVENEPIALNRLRFDPPYRASVVKALNLVRFTSETFPTLISNSFVVLVGQVDFYYLRFFFKPCSSFLYKNPSSRLEL
ncbi:uncharacterized protein Gasu_61100 [Galdieria sulphuraria]|uniref:Uncharacterized protein n=1 Tax=Galdieria sulphuraria TaxID=130081 RepID=M2XRF8_GALSU|nr:uncharacterized protein Gasu_61100 [Galdieria sulphuraria]EME26248.1 hypothetical protein Gasu_61100 [Galdieria sulphuraria]|eukprot:XP_005702768.1 hypothetical protein Gasu_61100 [Galdieria sulphuraria]